MKAKATTILLVVVNKPNQEDLAQLQVVCNKAIINRASKI